MKKQITGWLICQFEFLSGHVILQKLIFFFLIIVGENFSENDWYKKKSDAELLSINFDIARHSCVSFNVILDSETD